MIGSKFRDKIFWNKLLIFKKLCRGENFVKSNKLGYFWRDHVPNLQKLVLGFSFDALLVEKTCVLWKGQFTRIRAVARTLCKNGLGLLVRIDQGGSWGWGCLVMWFSQVFQFPIPSQYKKACSRFSQKIDVVLPVQSLFSPVTKVIRNWTFGGNFL